VGAFAYSQGLEYAVECAWVTDRDSAQRWITGLLCSTVECLDIPRLSRLYRAFATGDHVLAERENLLVLAAREASELQAEELHLGSALIKLLVSLGKLGPNSVPERQSYIAAFALAAVRFDLSLASALGSYCFAWLEHQTSAATRLVPLGQTDGQLILSHCLELVPEVIFCGGLLPDDAVGAMATGQAMASALHETQYSRLFRS
jgi:urease accessory protein